MLKGGQQTMKKQAYKINKEKKTIIIDDQVKQTERDKQDIQMYVSAGYEIKHKSIVKSKQALKRSDSITADEIRKKLSADKEALKEFERLLRESGYFSARKYYKEYITTEPAPEQKQKRATRKPAAEKENDTEMLQK